MTDIPKLPAELEQRLKVPIASPDAMPKMLDITTPAKWQMAVQVHMQRMPREQIDSWLQDFRVVFNVACALARDLTTRHLAGQCFVCGAPFKNTRDAIGGEAQYFDADGNLIKVYCCNMNEYPELLQKAMQKDRERARQEELIKQADRQALINIRQARSKVGE